jgi:hypothetical protein
MNKEEYEKRKIALITERNRIYNNIKNMVISISSKRNYIANVNTWFHSEINKLNEMMKNRVVDKYALLIGINYTGTKHELKGCVNDVNLIKDMLINRFQYKESNITILLNNQANRENILNKFKELFTNSKENDKLFFSFSGHGYLIHDFLHNNSTTNDDVIISFDMKTVSNKEISNIMYDYMKDECSLFMLYDSCHSGGLFESLKNEKKREISFLSGCQKKQKSLDVYFNDKYNGVTTYYMVEILSNNNDLSFNEFFDKMKMKLQSQRIKQIPQLMCNFDKDFIMKI